MIRPAYAMAGNAPDPAPAASPTPGTAGKPAPGRPAKKASSGPKRSLLRELTDELTFVFLIVVFFKLFIVDLYKIPSGSMTPTLIGGRIAEVDADQDGRKDIAYWSENLSSPPLIFLRGERRYVAAPERYGDPSQAVRWLNAGLSFERFDRILVNKLAFWWRAPQRGEIVVFRVPEVIFDPAAPIYIKRVTGESGDQLSFDPEGRLIANGSRVTSPEFFAEQRYSPLVDTMVRGMRKQPWMVYEPADFHTLRIKAASVPAGELCVFGDNTMASLDSRYWGGVPEKNIKGRAFLRIFPLTKLGLLK